MFYAFNYPAYDCCDSVPYNCPGIRATKDVISSDQKNGTSRTIIFLFDATGCMGDKGKIENVKNASRNSFESLNKTDEAALIVFYDCDSIILGSPSRRISHCSYQR